MGVGRNYRKRHLLQSLHTPLVSSTFIHLIMHTRRLRVLGTHLTFLKNLNRVNICPSKASPPSVATHIFLVNTYHSSSQHEQTI